MLSLRFNSFVLVNFFLVMEQFPDLKYIHLRNNPLNCERVDASVSFTLITDCNASNHSTASPFYRFTASSTSSDHKSTAKSSSITNAVPVANFSSTLTFYHPSIRRFSSQHRNDRKYTMVYLTALCLSLISIPTVITCLRSMIQLWTAKWRRQQQFPRSLELLHFNSENAENDGETIIFDVTAL